MPIPAKILVVDDQRYVRHTLRSLLAEQRRWSIYEAADGKAALDSARKLKPDVVVMDIVMPVMDGISATYELRQFAPETKVVLISSNYTPHEAAILARLFGDGTFVTKAAAGKDLVPAVSRLLPPEKQAVQRAGTS
ncbi:MAG: response regulator [Acidobacteria bacterium]|nr:MAG: response regulator [Acidobacteriota bacterium]